MAKSKKTKKTKTIKPHNIPHPGVTMNTDQRGRFTSKKKSAPGKKTKRGG